MRRRTLLSGLILASTLACPALASGDLESALERCAEIRDPGERLACYDKLAVGEVTDPADDGRREAAGSGRWEIRATDDPLGRGESVSLILGSDRVEPQLDSPVFLVLRCVQGRPELFLDWRVPMGNQAIVTSTFGSREPATLVWDLSADGSSAFYPSRSIDDFVLQMVEVEDYLASAPVQGGFTVEARFSPGGLENALERMRQGCGWSPTATVDGGGDRASLSDKDKEYRTEALRLFYERCEVDPDSASGEKAYADWNNLRDLSYTPKRMWQLAKKIPKSCRSQSFRDEIISRGDP